MAVDKREIKRRFLIIALIFLIYICGAKVQIFECKWIAMCFSKQPELISLFQQPLNRPRQRLLKVMPRLWLIVEGND